ncbi:tetratricopeptide repeat protein [Jannaschia ovalis]|uniref:Tetratricopeptide repeat protein n=1 Tax=Jannaschia ovalis TaxID=3038773 RepID=A0ABY8LEY2_9RHOB|nr:tetratricopeptide repeat protein [Jannaschia sp. GRR-S6-38]WGH78733.1 tetratricopeptide repeat protein [Jannaschia sp. GRR-S6-38]
MRFTGGFMVSVLAVVLLAAAVLLVPSRADEATLLLRDGKARLALSVAEDAIEADPADERALRILAQTQMHLGRTRAAETTLRRRMDVTGPTHLALLDLGRLYRSLGRPQDAAAYFLELPAETLTQGEQAYVAGWLRRARDPETERAFLAAVLRGGNLDQAGTQRYAELLAASGQSRESLEVFRALDQKGELDHRGMLQFYGVLLASGSVQEAAERAAAWAAGPGSEQLVEGIAQLDVAFAREEARN